MHNRVQIFKMVYLQPIFGWSLTYRIQWYRNGQMQTSSSQGIY